MSVRASADLLIDRQRLSEVVGREVRATRLRFKPGLSTTAVLLDATDGPEWIQASHRAHADKLGKAVELAAQRGRDVHVHEVDGLTVAHGPVDTDARLQKALDQLRPVHPSVAAAVAGGQLTVLRYNPQRRLVLRDDRPDGDPVVLRVTGHKQVGVRRALRRVAAAGVPVVEPLESHGYLAGRRVTVWPWFGRGDLASDPGGAERAALAAGTALARLHRSGLALGPVPDPIVALARQAVDLEDLDPAAADRMRAQAAAVGRRVRAHPWATGPIHGDFSADQVLVGRPGEESVRLTDFDRAGTGALVADLGSFAAAELLSRGQDWSGVGALPHTRALLEGYGWSGPEDELRTWVARALLTRVIEPFRSADPQWVRALHDRLDQVEQVLA